MSCNKTMKSNVNRISFIDLFAGIGGFHTAMHSVGVHCVFASEWDKYARISYEENYKNIEPHLFEKDKDGNYLYFNGDITEANPKVVERLYKRYNSERIVKETMASTVRVASKHANTKVSECKSYVDHRWEII